MDMTPDLRDVTCCFTGHRSIAPVHEDDLPGVLEQVIRTLYSAGVYRFVTGGALGFDTLAAETVLSLRDELERMHLTVVAPFLRQADRWRESDRARYERICSGADEYRVLRSSYTRFCMRERNHAMVDMSGVCISYLYRRPSGTSQTVDYAMQSGLYVISITDILGQTENPADDFSAQHVSCPL